MSTWSNHELRKIAEAVFPDQKPINSTFINTWEDPKVTDPSVVIASVSGKDVHGDLANACTVFPCGIASWQCIVKR